MPATSPGADAGREAGADRERSHGDHSAPGGPEESETWGRVVTPDGEPVETPSRFVSDDEDDGEEENPTRGFGPDKNHPTSRYPVIRDAFRRHDGGPIRREVIREETGVTKPTAIKWVEGLLDAGYLTTRVVPTGPFSYGVAYEVASEDGLPEVFNV